jgi:alpha-mannosidase
MRFALEAQNPFVAGLVKGGDSYPETNFSLLTTSNPEVLLWALKPSEDGIDKGIVTRFWSMSPQSGKFTVKVNGGLQKASAITHIETDFRPRPLTGGELRIDAKPWQMQSFSLLPLLKSAIMGSQVTGK